MQTALEIISLSKPKNDAEQIKVFIAINFLAPVFSAPAVFISDKELLGCLHWDLLILLLSKQII